MKKVHQFFWFCSGAYSPLLKRAPTETHKYTGIGGTVFFTGLLAAISATYALFTVFQSMLYAVVFGLIWGLMIFNLDRFIVSSMKKRNDVWSEWKMALPRLVFAILLAVVISKPLELKIFEREIDRKLEEKKTEMIAQSKMAIESRFVEVNRLEATKDSLKNELTVATAYRDKLQQEYDHERFGTKTEGTSGIVGIGTNAKKKEQQFDAAQHELVELKAAHQIRIDGLDAQIQQVKDRQDEELDRQMPSIEGVDGLAARLDALALLTSDSRAMYWSNIMIILLFIAVETAPIFVKLISPRGPYDDILEMHEESVSVYAHEQRVKTKDRSAYRIKVFNSTLSS